MRRVNTFRFSHCEIWSLIRIIIIEYWLITFEIYNVNNFCYRKSDEESHRGAVSERNALFLLVGRFYNYSSHPKCSLLISDAQIQ